MTLSSSPQHIYDNPSDCSRKGSTGGNLLCKRMVPRHRDEQEPDCGSHLFRHIQGLIESLQPLTVLWNHSHVAGTLEMVQ